MKKIILFFLCLSTASLSLSKELKIITYDSFNSEWGPGPIVFSAFEKHCNCRLKIITAGDAGEVLSKSILQKKRYHADIVLGLSDSQLAQAFEHDLFIVYKPKNLEKINSDFIDPQYRVTPFDYGNLAFVYQSKKIKNPPTSLDDLLDARFRGKIVIEHPLTSSPGLSFLLWTIVEKGENGYLDYWKKLKPNILTIASNWSTAYGMFTQGEADIVLSYSTSPAYHLEYEKTDIYKTALFKNGHYPQIEYAAILKNAQNKKLARAFIDFMLSKKFQSHIPLTNWMFPVIKYDQLPKSYSIVPQTKSLKPIEYKRLRKNSAHWIDQWSQVLN